MVTFFPKSRCIIINCLKVKNDSYEEVLCSIRKGIFYSLILCLLYLLPCVSFLGGREFVIFPTLCSHSFFCALPSSEEPCMSAAVTTSAKWPPGFLPALDSSCVQSEHSVRISPGSLIPSARVWSASHEPDTVLSSGNSSNQVDRLSSWYLSPVERLASDKEHAPLINAMQQRWQDRHYLGTSVLEISFRCTKQHIVGKTVVAPFAHHVIIPRCFSTRVSLSSSTLQCPCVYTPLTRCPFDVLEPVWHVWLPP